MKTYSFENLEVWNDTRELTKNIYTITRNFPEDEKFGITSQIRRAIISVSSNIAEGSSRRTKKDQSYFYTIAFSSLIEVLSQVIMSKDLKFINEQDYIETRKLIEKISNKLNALRNSCLKP